MSFIPLNARAAVDRVDANMMRKYRRLQRAGQRIKRASFGVVGQKDKDDACSMVRYGGNTLAWVADLP